MKARRGRSRKWSGHGAKVTLDHREIRKWIEARDAKPAIEREGEHDIRLQFTDDRSGELRSISWSQFFERFEEENLAMVYQEMGDGGEMRYFCAFISRG